MQCPFAFINDTNKQKVTVCAAFSQTEEENLVNLKIPSNFDFSQEIKNVYSLVVDYINNINQKINEKIKQCADIQGFTIPMIPNYFNLGCTIQKTYQPSIGVKKQQQLKSAESDLCLDSHTKTLNYLNSSSNINKQKSTSNCANVPKQYFSATMRRHNNPQKYLNQLTDFLQSVSPNKTEKNIKKLTNSKEGSSTPKRIKNMFDEISQHTRSIEFDFSDSQSEDSVILTDEEFEKRSLRKNIGPNKQKYPVTTVCSEFSNISFCNDDQNEIIRKLEEAEAIKMNKNRFKNTHQWDIQIHVKPNVSSDIFNKCSSSSSIYSSSSDKLLDN